MHTPVTARQNFCIPFEEEGILPPFYWGQEKVGASFALFPAPIGSGSLTEGPGARPHSDDFDGHQIKKGSAKKSKARHVSMLDNNQCKSSVIYTLKSNFP